MSRPRRLSWVGVAIAVVAAIGGSGVPAEAQRRGNRRGLAHSASVPLVAILCYHDIRLNPSRWATSPEQFEAHLQALKAQGVAFMTVSEALAALASPAPETPRRIAVLTIDDGFRSAYTVAFPLAQRYGAKLTLFVYTRWIGTTKTALSWSELRAMVRSGLVEVGSHTVTHAYPRQLRRHLSDAAFQRRMLWEFAESKRVLEQQLGVPVDGLAYPGGQVTETLKDLARAAGYKWAVTVNPRWVTPNSDPYTLPRFGVDRTTRVATLLRWLAVPPVLARYRR